MNYKPGDVVRFTYSHQVIDEASGDQFKEVFVLNPDFNGEMHGIDLKRLTEAQRVVITMIMDPKVKYNVKWGKNTKIPLVNDIVRRMDPVEEIKNPQSFYYKFVKRFLKDIDAYRRYEPALMVGITIVHISEVTGPAVNPKPAFHKVESKQNGETPQTPDTIATTKGKTFKKI